jgi:uncharacterized protein (DUF1697 family)
MADLRALLTDLGYENVRTLRNSGNIVLNGGAPADVAPRIEAALVERLGVSSRVMVLAADELAAVVRDNPLLGRADNPSCLQIAFLADATDGARLEPLLESNWDPEALALGTRAAYLWCPDGLNKSALHKAVRRALGDRMTTRTWSTVLKLHALASA